MVGLADRPFPCVQLVLVLLLVIITGSPAVAGELPLTNSLEVQLGSGPKVVIPIDPDNVTLQDGVFSEGLEVLIIGPSAPVFGPSTSFFAGLPPLTGPVSGAVSPADPVTPFLLAGGQVNQTAFENNVVTGFGATNGPPFSGVVQFETAASTGIPIPLRGAGGANRLVTSCNFPCTFGRLHTGPAVITGITTPRVSVAGVGTGAVLTLRPTGAAVVRSLTTGGAFVSTGAGPAALFSTVTVSGTNSLSTSQPGAVTLVAPIRIPTGPVLGTLPGEIRLRLAFVPEPETLLLQLAAAAGLVLVGRFKRQRRR